MTIDLSSEHLLSLAEAAKTLPGRPHSSTIWRWHSRGVRGIRLETVVIGGRRFTSRESLERFARRTTAAADGLPASANPASEASSESLAQVEAELDSVGI